MMDIRFDGKRALVTGAGQGIGRAVAKALVEGGAETYALSRTQKHLDSLKQEVPDVHILSVDVGDWEATRAAVQSIGPIDLLVNNAALAANTHSLEVKPEEFDLLMNVNVKGAMNISQVVGAGMKERGRGGSIVNVSSQASKIALQGHLTYCMTKAALDMMTQMMALELGPHQIRVNAVNPTVVMTEMGRLGWSDPAKADPMLARIPQRKFAEVKDVVHAILFLLSDKADMINGTHLPVDGGVLAN